MTQTVRFRDYLYDSKLSDAFNGMTAKIKGGLSSGATLSAQECHMVLMSFAHHSSTEQAFIKLIDEINQFNRERNHEQPPKEKKSRSERSAAAYKS